MAFDCDILIVGGGPTGITLALIAAQHGASVIICEKEADIYPLPRAAHVDHEVMRIFQSVGAADAIAATSRRTTHYDFLTANGELLLRFDGSDQTGPGGWPAANMIHQPSVERALRDRLAFTSGAELRSNWTFTGYREDPAGVTVRFETPAGDSELTARYLIGADGTRSPVRSAAGIELDDLQFDEPWLVVDTIVHDFARLPKVNLQICDPARPTTCVLMGEGRHRWEFMLLPGETEQDIASDASIERLLEPWQVDGAVTLERKAVYRFNARVAEQWRKGRVLLAGDAAHQTPPFAGQGMCAGIRDAANLGWKLGLIASGQAGDAVLDSYQQEREPHVRATIELAMMMGKMVCITDPLAAEVRNQQMLAARAAGQGPGGEIAFPPLAAGLVSTGSAAAGSYFPQFVADNGARIDDALGTGWWLIGDVPAGAEIPGAVECLQPGDDRLAPWHAALQEWLARIGSPAVLVRPDRYVFGADEASVLLAAWQQQLQASSCLA